MVDFSWSLAAPYSADLPRSYFCCRALRKRHLPGAVSRHWLDNAKLSSRRPLPNAQRETQTPL